MPHNHNCIITNYNYAAPCLLSQKLILAHTTPENSAQSRFIGLPQNSS
ncbi:hypothetical protein CLOSYM_03579 [[Clostridium] symbiosum ATCC 14940]|uniref:Uncharacterized protein n=1 Tax=[Clostridium] symbiosum ATCC 14940 TaxID=411472 RepID=A0ABC9TU30_CLOSY|nr:hypothetical protein CLOSYM_03579 [[Clostridium] symbiosum ATCC 14940]